MIDLRSFDIVTFDCYGTLIDWEAGILGALQAFRHDNAVRAGDDEILAQYAALEQSLEGGDHILYREVLRGVMRGLARRYSVAPERVNLDLLADSLGNWPPFADTVESLTRLKQRYRLAIISNTDDDLFAQTARVLGVSFDFVITAQQVKAYKPSLQNFEHALAVMKVPKQKVLHAAQSRYHDIAPARALGIATVWVNRRAGKANDGASGHGAALPDLEVPDLKTLADRAEAGA